MKRHINKNKKGVCLVEGAIIIPFFLLAMFILISIMPVIANYEEMVYDTCDELQFASIKSKFIREPLSLPDLEYNRIKENCHKVNYVNITDYKYLFKKDGIDDLISIGFAGEFNKKNPLLTFNSIRFDSKIMCRAFTGTYFTGKASTDSDNSKEEMVYIFPNYGNKYHNKMCRFLNPACQREFLNPSIKRKYKACPYCKSKKATFGTPVYVFEKDGKSYHLGDCKYVDKYYVEIDKKEAERQGYVPCEVCGG